MTKFQRFVDALRRKLRMMGAVGAVGAMAAMGACAGVSQTASDITAVIGSGPTSTALAYVGALDPKVQTFLASADAAIAKDAPTVLKYACGGVSMGVSIVQAAEAFVPSLAGNSVVAKGDAVAPALEQACGTSAAAPPATVAAAAGQALAAYQNVSSALAAAGVKLPPAPAASSRREMLLGALAID